jgi:hypothetical protein
MVDQLFNVKSHFERRANLFSEIGINLLSLNKFLSNFLYTDEPFPPTDQFIENMREDAENNLIPNLVAPFKLPEEEEEINNLFNGLNLGAVSHITQKKVIVIRDLYQYAHVALVIEKAYKMYAENFQSPPEIDKNQLNNIHRIFDWLIMKLLELKLPLARGYTLFIKSV